METTKIIGGPGTGKTGYILNHVAEDCDRMFPKEIGVVSLTKAAVRTVKWRIRKKLDIGEDDIPNVGTIHSLCFHMLGRPVPADPKIEKMPGFDKQKHKQIQVLRNQFGDIPKHLASYNDKYEAWKEANGYTDFTGMMEAVLKERIPLKVRSLYCDESQDQTPLAHALVRMWAENAEQFTAVGDGDQSLYRFSGARPESFIGMEYDYMGFRGQSYRLAPAVHDHCMTIIGKCKIRDVNRFRPITPEIVRKQQEWNPDMLDYSEGKIHALCAYPDLSLPGSHMILVRANYMTDKWRKWLSKEGVPFHNPYRRKDLAWNPTETAAWKAAACYYDLMAGKECSAEGLHAMADAAIAKEVFKVRGGKKAFVESLTSSDDQFGLLSRGFKEDFVFPEKPDLKRYFRLKGDSGQMVMNLSPEKVTQKPRVILGTIHSVKGGEADHVWIDEGTTPAIKAEYIRNVGHVRDDEVRVMYVAASRARHSVGYLANPSNRNPVLY
jgi:DNA helicase-2/ATP-dependent DNA helicase PcrA